MRFLNGLDKAMLKDHGLFRDLRDKLITHSVNVLEENQVIAQLEGDLGSRVKDISVLERRLAVPSDETIVRLKELSSIFLSGV